MVSGLRTALVGRAIVRFDGPGVDGPEPALGRMIDQVEHTGRQVEVVFDDGLVLHTNLRFGGVWHLYREGARWRRPMRQLRVAIAVPGWVAACFNASAETYREFDRYRHPGFGRLGPDLSSAHPDVDVGVAQMLAYFDPDAVVADVLVDPQVVCGIGNVYRSEVLWACAVHPLTRVDTLSEALCHTMLTTAAAMLRDNFDAVTSPAPSDTRDALHVYGRNGQRCERCGDTIAVRRFGGRHRLLYWCDGCQFDHASAQAVVVEQLSPWADEVPAVPGLPTLQIPRVPREPSGAPAEPQVWPKRHLAG